MNAVKLIPMLSMIASLLRPLFFAMIGGFIVVGANRCSSQPAVNLVVTNQQYEKQLQEIQKKQQIIANKLPHIDSALQYISKRYPAK